MKEAKGEVDGGEGAEHYSELWEIGEERSGGKEEEDERACGEVWGCGERKFRIHCIEWLFRNCNGAP